MLKRNTKVLITEGFYKSRVGTIYSVITTRRKNLDHVIEYYVILQSGEECFIQPEHAIEFKGELAEALYGEVDADKTQEPRKNG